MQLHQLPLQPQPFHLESRKQIQRSSSYSSPPYNYFHYGKKWKSFQYPMYGMMAATLYALEAEGCIALTRRKRGRILKKDTVDIRKTRSFKYRRFGYLSKGIYKMRVGESINIYEMTKKLIGRSKDPSFLFVSNVVSNDLNNKTKLFLYDIDIRDYLLRDLVDNPNVRRGENIRLYEAQARELDRIVGGRVNSDPALYKAIENEL